MLLMFINILSLKTSLIFCDFLTLITFSFILFILGLVGIVLNKKNFLLLLLCIELMLIAIGLNFIFISLVINKLAQIFTLFVITIAATESSIGLGLLIVLYRLKQTINLSEISTLNS